MEMVAVSAVVGVMKPLLVKLTMLMGDEYKMLTEVRKQVPFFESELHAMSDFLERLADCDQLDPQMKGWRDHVREMAYDIEDCIDEFIVMCHDSTASVGCLEKLSRYLNRLKEHRRIASQFMELRRRIGEESERRKRYTIDSLPPSSSTVAFDHRVAALYTVTTSLVGIDLPREELVNKLVDEQPQMKVISIVGFGGLGKTTLAKQVYETIGEQFDCKVFVSVSQRPDLIGLLKKIQSNLRIECSPNDQLHDILDSLRNHLQHKRYLIVVDDLWDVREWKIIFSAFPADNNKGSRVIVTTRVHDVASQASRSNRQCIYKMKPLNNQDARRLFLNRIFRSEDGFPSHYKEVSAHYEEVPDQILRICGGIPLAIMTIAGLLASQQERLMDNWDRIRNSLGDPFATNSTLEGMRQILDLSYKNLPHHLRTCFLYLGKYPEDHEIKRDDVVRQWMAEGFVSPCQRQGDQEDVAKDYFNELVNKSLIQPERSDCGKVLSCRVHDMIRDLILMKCADNNFVSVAYNSEDLTREHNYMYNVRRLSLHSNVDIASDGIVVSSGTINSRLLKVRSLSLLGTYRLRVPLSFLAHKFLRVLDLQVTMLAYRPTAEGQIAYYVGTTDLTIISQLFQLRYLKVDRSTCHIRMPHRISRLEHLETMEILSIFDIMPSDIADLPRLSRLVVNWGERMPDGLGRLTSLRTLAGFDLLRLDTEALGELTNLRNLKLCCQIDNSYSIGERRNLPEMRLCGGAYGMNVAAASGVDSLYSSIARLRGLRYLEIRPLGVVLVDDADYLGILDNPPPTIEILKLKGFLFSRIPRWIRARALNHLRRLELLVSGTSTDEVSVLGELPYLLHFVLELEGGPPAANAIMFSTGFLALESLCFYFCDANATSYMGLQFQVGVMPRLQRLTLQFDHREWGSRATPVGIEHLLGLQHIHVEFQDHQQTFHEMYTPPPNFFGDALLVLRNTVESHPNRPPITPGWDTRRYYRMSIEFDDTVLGR